jgi:hypothetical protein
VTVKHGKNTYEVDVDPKEGLDTFQAMLFSLAQVPTERQKLLFKGKFIKVRCALAATFSRSRRVVFRNQKTWSC